MAWAGVGCVACAWGAERSSAAQEKDAVAKELEDLNSTVFSKSFKAPSAWAEREVKHKMEKRAWEIEVRPPPAHPQHTG